jgi:ubiquitin carboxyl-terminal hydrolase 8
MSNETDYSGLYNNTSLYCYMNSIIQSLLLSPSIINSLLDDEEHEKDIMYLELINKIEKIEDLETDEYKENDITIEKIKYLKFYFNFKQLIIKLLKKEEHIIDPKSFIIEFHKLVVNSPMFSVTVQNDAQEGLIRLLDFINDAKGSKKQLETTNSSILECQNAEEKLVFLAEKSFQQHYSKYNHSWVIKNFFSQFITVLKCNQCVHHSLKFEPYQELAVEIPSIKDLTIYDCLDNFFGKEIFDIGEEWKCDNCENKEGNFKQYRIVDFANTLIIFFKRYKWNMLGNMGNKNEHKIDFPFQLNMNKYKLLNKELNTQYELYSVVNQIGAYNSGHYFTYSRNLNSDTDTNWYEFNDSRVNKMNECDVVTKNAYILFYQKKKVIV